METWESFFNKPDKMNKVVIVLGVSLIFMFSWISCAPQNNAEVSKYKAYNYDYKVEDAEKKLFFDKSEASDETGKVWILSSYPCIDCKSENLIY